MGKIFFKKTLAIEWRAERMLIVENDKIVLDEPTVIAVDKSQKRTRYAVGNAALKLAGQPNIEICRPFIRDGIVAHWRESHRLFSEILCQRFGAKWWQLLLGYTDCYLVAVVPDDATDAELHNIRHVLPPRDGFFICGCTYLIHRKRAIEFATESGLPLNEFSAVLGANIAFKKRKHWDCVIR
jgi:hypothetical protein